MTARDDGAAIRFERDGMGMIDWAFLPNSIFALARFVSDGRIYLVPNATTPSHNVAGSFITITNAKYEHAASYAAFKRLAIEFDNDGRE